MQIRSTYSPVPSFMVWTGCCLIQQNIISFDKLHSALTIYHHKYKSCPLPWWNLLTLAQVAIRHSMIGVQTRQQYQVIWWIWHSGIIMTREQSSLAPMLLNTSDKEDKDWKLCISKGKCEKSDKFDSSSKRASISYNCGSEMPSG